LTKPEVREIAAKMELVTAEKKDSQGLCFIGAFYQILQQKLEQKRSAIIQIDKDHSIYSTESQQELSSKESLVLASKKRHTP
jgi:tRNA-specific 2-thiouridylase